MRRLGTSYHHLMVDRDAIMDVLRGIDDPEMPISIVELGIVEDVIISRLPQGEGSGVRVFVSILPTFIGCPALDMIRAEIIEKVSALADVHEVEVEFINDPPWSADRITSAGRESLRAYGVAVPGLEESGGTVMLTTSVVACPFCGSTQTQIESAFGPTRCRMIYYCDACRNSFERIKKL